MEDELGHEEERGDHLHDNDFSGDDEEEPGNEEYDDHGSGRGKRQRRQ